MNIAPSQPVTKPRSRVCTSQDLSGSSEHQAAHQIMIPTLNQAETQSSSQIVQELKGILTTIDAQLVALKTVNTADRDL